MPLESDLAQLRADLAAVTRERDAGQKRIEKLEALCEEAAVELSEVAKMMPNPGWYGQSVRMRAVAARLRAVDLPKTREMISDEAARLRAKGERG